jgi:outer membrane receptor protein involved in Fe transport
MKTPLLARRWPLLAAAPLFLTLAAAQTAPAPSAPVPAAPGNGDDVLKMDQFVVSSTAATGYRANSSLTATGIGTPIGDTPMPLTVITNEMIQDTNSLLIIDALRYVPGVITTDTNESAPSIRGISGSYSLRNGVFRRQNLTTWNVDDVEVIQGISSIFYGNIRPGGMINYNTIKPVLGQTWVDTDLSGGSYNYRRGEADFNVAAGSDAAVRVVLGSLDTNSFRIDNQTNESFVSAAFLWRPTPQQQLTIEADDEETHRTNAWSDYIFPLTNSQYWGNPAAIASGQSVSTWMAANHPGQPVYNEFAPFAPAPNDPYGRVTPMLSNTYQHTSDKPVDVTYVNQLTDQLVFNTILNYAWEDNEGTNAGYSGDPLANDSFTGVNASRFVNVRDSYNANFRLTYHFDVAGTSNTLMAGDDNQYVYQRYPQNAILSPGVANSAFTVTSNNEVSTPTYTWFPTALGVAGSAGNADQLIQNTPASAQFNAEKETLQIFRGPYFVEQLAALENKLHFIAGVRDIDFLQRLTWPHRPDLEKYAVPNATAKKWTPQVGAIYEVLPGFSLYATYATAVQPQTQVDASGLPVQPITFKGWDAGTKVNFLGGALTGDVDLYHIFETNTAISNPAANIAAGLPSNATYGYYTYGNAAQINGLQADLDYNISNNYQVKVGINEFYEAANVAPQATASAIGTPLAYVPATTYSLWNRYEFTEGVLKGFVIGGGALHNSEASYGGNFNDSLVNVPGWTIFNALASYRLTVFGKHSALILNVNNLGNKIYRDSNVSFGDPRTFVVSLRTRW